MSKGMIRTGFFALFLLLPVAAMAAGEIYKIVDKDGNVTYTDQRPSTDAQPIDLPELSVVETDIQVPEKSTAEAAAKEPREPTPRELRKLYRDFQITQPQQEETFWGTANKVVVSWGSKQAMLPGLSVMLYVDGEPQEASAQGGVTLTLDRGEHKVYAELRDPNGRRIVTTETVTFFVKQHSANFGGN
jgi:hypothetical protein